MNNSKRLTRSSTERMLGGVCGGLANYFDLDPTLIRIAFAALIMIGAGSPVLLYLMLWIIIPAEDSPRALAGRQQAAASAPAELPAPTEPTAVAPPEVDVVPAVETPKGEDMPEPV